MSWRNIVKSDDGTTRTFTHLNSEHDAKGWNENLARDNHAEVRLEHVADGPYDYSGKVTHVQTINGRRSC